MNLNTLPILFVVMAVWVVPTSAFAKTVAEWDFSDGPQGWSGNSRVESLSSPPEGLIVKSTRQEPWIEGSAVDLPGDKKAYHVLISGIEEEPSEVGVREVVEDSDKPLSFKSANEEFHSEYKILTVTLEGRSEIQNK